MYKKCFIVCWIGKFPEYFKYWERSCGNNLDYDFLIFTDQNYSPIYKNIICIQKTIDDLKELIEQRLDIKIDQLKPYKLCDFRPAFGIIFSEYIREYDFWGHCDIDQIFGKISNFLTENILEKSEKINKNGPFSLYRNNEKINNLYKKDGAKFSYKEVFSTKENFAFDEFTGINMIVKKSNINLYLLNEYADLDVKYKRLKMHNDINYKIQTFLWEDEKIYRTFVSKDGKIIKEELMYLHFQKKNPDIKCKINDSKIMIGSNGFEKYSFIDKETILKSNHYNGGVYENFEKVKYYINKMYKFIKCNKKQKQIWIRQKI